MTIEVSIDALEDDAAFWDNVAVKLTDIRTSMDAATLAPIAFGVAGRGLAAHYDAVFTTVGMLLNQGAASATSTSTTLRSVRDAYADQENAASAAYSEMWEPNQP